MLSYVVYRVSQRVGLFALQAFLAWSLVTQYVSALLDGSDMVLEPFAVVSDVRQLVKSRGINLADCRKPCSPSQNYGNIDQVCVTSSAPRSLPTPSCRCIVSNISARYVGSSSYCRSSSRPGLDLCKHGFCTQWQAGRLLHRITQYGAAAQGRIDNHRQGGLPADIPRQVPSLSPMHY